MVLNVLTVKKATGRTIAKKFFMVSLENANIDRKIYNLVHKAF